MLEAVVVGAGPAGLASSHELARRGLPHVVLERGDLVGHTWRHLYDSLVLHTGKHFSALPGMPYPKHTPLFPTRADVVAYLTTYAERFRLPVQTSADVVRVERADGAWHTTTTRGVTFQSRAVVIATGIVASPHTPPIAGLSSFRGRVRHSVDYHRPADVTGRALVVGAGNSAAEIAGELAGADLDVTLAVRSGAYVVPRTFWGVPAQYVGLAFGYLPGVIQRAIIAVATRAASWRGRKRILPAPPPSECLRTPLIGFHLVEGIRNGRIRLAGGVVAFTPAGARFADGSEQRFDDVILATGYRAAVECLGDQIKRDACGFGSRRERVVSRDQPGLFFVGHNVDARGGLFSLARDAKRAGKLIGRAS